jgi:hypothetical protein
VRRDRPREAAPNKDARGGRSLALIPLGVAVLLAALLLPRKAVPDTVPLPELDDRIIAHEIRADAERADRARRVPLSPDVRELGGAVRAFNTAEAQDEKDLVLSDARLAIDRALVDVAQRGKGANDEVLELRAVQMEGFLAEVRRFERTGQTSPELDALGGTFIRRMRRVGWCEGNRVVMTDLERRAAFKTTWNKLVELDKDEAFALSSQETRALYTLYFSHPRCRAAESGACPRARPGERRRDVRAHR